MRYKEFIRRFELISENESEFNVSNYISTLAELRNRSNLATFLTSIISRDDLIESISETSYLHQNGFNKYFLYVSPKFGWKIRLHIWEIDNEIKASDIHNHAWDYASLIILGEITNEVYARRSNNEGEQYYYHIYQIDDKTTKSRLDYCGNEYLYISDQTQVFSEGELYSQSSSVLHKVIPKVGLLTATLVFQQKPWRSITDVYKKDMIQTVNQIGVLNRKNLPDEVRRAFSNVISNL